MLTLQESLNIFGLSDLSNENLESLKQIYHNLANKYHPDRGGTNKQFIEIRLAYGILKENLEISTQNSAQQHFDEKTYQEKIKLYEDLINREIVLINQTQEKIQSLYNLHTDKKSQIDLNFSTARDQLQQKFNYKWYDYILPTKKLTKEEYFSYNNQLTQEYNSLTASLDQELFELTMTEYQRSFVKIVDLLRDL